MNPRYLLVLIFITILAISACGIEQTASSFTETPEAAIVPTVTHTSPPPSATPIPMAVMINGEGITLEEYEAELDRYQSAQDNNNNFDPSSAGKVVLEDLISQTLLGQAADENGFELTQADFDARLEKLILDAGGQAEFNLWLQANGYDLDLLKVSLERSIKSAWMRDLILSDVPNAVPHVNLRQLFFLDGEQASQVLAELESGRDFATTAAELDPLSRGEIGWVPRNYLPHKEIEEVAFTLQPGELSQVIESAVGYHIIQVVAVEDEHRLSPAAWLIWQEVALHDWVSLRREVSNIEIIALE